jgi:hypothetical protein
MINKIIKSGGPGIFLTSFGLASPTYLLMWHCNQYLVKACPRGSSGQSSRLFNLLVSAHSLNARACSFFVQGTILWNNLQPAVKRGESMGKFILLVLYLLLGKYISKLIETPVLHTQLSFRSTNVDTLTV